MFGIKFVLKFKKKKFLTEKSKFMTLNVTCVAILYICDMYGCNDGFV